MKQILNIKRLGKSFVHALLTQHHYLGGICLIIAIITIIFSFQNINYFHIDFGGHIASSTMFERYGFHGRNPDRFNGLINNLFYPPGEDTIVRIIRTLTGLNHINAFMTYIALVIAGYWIASYMIIRRITNKFFAITMIVGLATFFFLDKTENISYFQGGSLMDLLFTGLTSQGLGVAFFLLFISEYLRPTPTSWRLGVLAILTFLSHLVVGPIAFLLRGMSILSHRKRQDIIYFALSIGITSFFWIPFGYYKSLGSSAFIVQDLPLLLMIIAIIGCAISYIKNIRGSLGLFLVSIIILFPNYLSIRWHALTGYNYPLPIFHYYRFASIALLCCIIGGIVLTDKLYKIHHNKKSLYLGGISIVTLLSIILHYFGILGFEKMGNTIGDRDEAFTDYVMIEKLYPIMNNNKRILTIDINRPIDFGLDSYFQYMTPGLPFVKGLFRESYAGNQLQSSYIASLLAPQNIVLDFHYTNTRDQPEYNRLRDGFAQTYNIGRILIGPPNKIGYLNRDRHNMISTLINEGTVDNVFRFQDSVVIQGVSFELYEIKAKKKDTTDGFVRLLQSAEQIVPIDMTKKHFSEDILNIIKKESPIERQKDLIFFDKKNIPDYTLPIGSGKAVYTTDGTSYTIDLGDSPQSIVVRLPNLPGRTIEGDDNQLIQVSHGIYDKIISGTGKITLSYHRTGIMIISYILSLLSLCGFVYRIYQHKK